MDIIPRPQDPAYPSIEIPFLCCAPHAYRYDYQGFSDYPKRCGWDKHALTKGYLGGRTAENAAAFVQSWLYFAAIAELLTDTHGKHLLPNIEDRLTCVSEAGYPMLRCDGVAEAAFEYRESHTRVRLAEINGWIRLGKEAKEGLAKQTRLAMERVDDILTEVHTFLNLLRVVKTESATEPLVPEPIVLSIAVMGDLFGTLRNLLFVWGTAYQSQEADLSGSADRPVAQWEQLMGYGATKRIGSDGSEKVYAWGHIPVIDQRLVEQGWCPSDIHYLNSVAHTASHLYISQMPRFRKDHMHDNCTETQCRAYNVTSVYQHKHADQCQQREGCSLCELSWNAIQAIIDTGSIPVMTFDSPSSKLAVLSHAELSQTGFVAISHVWSDGLGNPQTTAVYSCQLRRIQGLVDRLHPQPGGGRTPFWLDTLCIPLSPPKLRSSAINRMATLYAEASHVLVLDAELEQTPATVSCFEGLFRIALSAWNRRLWTLQEGVLAKKLIFQFADGALSLESFYNELIARQRDRDQLQNMFGLGPLLQDSQNMNLVHTSIFRSKGSAKLTALSQALQRRSTKRGSDESICIATLLGLDLSKILEIPEDRMPERMAYIWKTQEEIPRTILRVDGPKLKDQGLPWAPASFMNTMQVMYNSQITCRQINGVLRVECSAFVLKTMNSPLELPAALVPATFEKDGILVYAISPKPGETLSVSLADPAFVIPDISSIMMSERGSRTFRAFLVNVDILDLVKGEIKATVETEVLLQFLGIQVEGDIKIPRPTDAHEMQIIIPPRERKSASYFGNAFSFTSTTNNGMVLDAMLEFNLYFIFKTILVLRQLTLIHTIKTHVTLDALEHFRTQASWEQQIRRGITGQERVRCYTVMQNVSLKLCLAIGHSAATVPEAVEYIIENQSKFDVQMLITRMSQGLLRGSGFAYESPLAELIDPDFEVIEKVELRQRLLDEVAVAVEYMWPPRLEPPDRDEDTCEHWENLFMAFLLQNLSAVKELYPPRQEWVLTFKEDALRVSEFMIY